MHILDLTTKEVVLLVLGAVLATIPAWYFARKRPPRGIDWLLLNGASIVPPSVRATTPDLHVVVEADGAGSTLGEPQIHVLRIFNSGRSDIVAADIPAGITIEQGGNKFASATVIGSHPDLRSQEFTIAPYAKLEAEQILIYPASLMPQRTWFDVQLLSDGPSGDPAVDAIVKNSTNRHPRRLDAVYLRQRGSVWIKALSIIMITLLVALFVGFAIALVLGKTYYRTERVAHQAYGPSATVFLNIWVISMVVLLAAFALVAVICFYQLIWPNIKVVRIASAS